MFRLCVSMGLVVASAAACGSAPAVGGAGAAPSAPSAEPSAAAAPPSSASSPPSVASAEPAKRRKPFEIHNTCSEVATIVFGEEPKNPEAGRRAVAPSSTIDGPRDESGKQTVWLLDAQGEPLVKVHVTKGMKQLEIGRSCRTLDAH